MAGKRGSKALSEWIRIARSMGFNKVVVDPATGKKKVTLIPKKGTPEYVRIKAEFEKQKAKGY